jgi:hypothetical protein
MERRAFLQLLCVGMVRWQLRRPRKLSPWPRRSMQLTLVRVPRRNQASPSLKTWTACKSRRPIMVMHVVSVDAFTDVITTKEPCR